MSTREALLGFVETPAEKTVDEKAVIAQAKARLSAQNEAEVNRQIWILAHDRSLFTEEGKFGGLPVDDQLRLLAEIMDFLEEETQEAIRKYQQSDYLEGIDWDDANDYIRINHLVNAAKHGVVLPDWKDRIAKIGQAFRYYPGRYSQRVVGFRQDAVQEAAAQIDQLSGEVPEGLTGKGLEFAPSAVGSGQKVYLDGQLVASLSNAKFGSKPTNGEVVAWLTVNQIDRCSIRGSQMMWEITAWRKGDEKPHRIFEDHAYGSERSLRLSAPNVSEDGTVVFEYRSDGEVTEKQIKL